MDMTPAREERDNAAYNYASGMGCVDGGRTSGNEAMNTLATLIAIAAWCGQPNAGLYGSGWSPRAVQQCRQAIWACLQKHPHDAQCFLDEKLDAEEIK